MLCQLTDQISFFQNYERIENFDEYIQQNHGSSIVGYNFSKSINSIGKTFGKKALYACATTLNLSPIGSVLKLVGRMYCICAAIACSLPTRFGIKSL